MNVKSTIFCALVLLMTSAILFAQKTEVTVRKGKVVAETQTATVNIDAGRKAILSPGKNPSVTVDDPMVDDVMHIYKWAEQEKLARKLVIDSVSIQSIKIESENRFTLAYLWETPNTDSKLSDTCRLGGASILDNPKYYDLQGNLLHFDLEKINEHSGNYSIRFQNPVAPGENFRYICVSQLNGSIRKEGPLRYMSIQWSTPNQLNYYRFILPPSAIFVDASRPMITADSFEGRSAVILRNYTGPIADGQATIAFLWPDKDGASLADLPDQYRGLRDSGEEELVQAGRLEMAQIIAGKVYTKQSTPLETLLSLFSGLVNGDKETLINLMGAPYLKVIADQQYDQYFSNPLARAMFAGFDFLDTPNWPSDPPNGYTHPVYLSRKGSQISAGTAMMIYRDGKWYSNGLNIGTQSTDSDDESPRKVTFSKDNPSLDSVTYNGLEPGKFMKRWLFLGPIHMPWQGPGYYPDNQIQRNIFDNDPMPLDAFEPTLNVNDINHKWFALESREDVIKLDTLFDTWYVTGYAWAQIEMDEETRGVLGIGSDDHVKVFLNGKCIHENWISRGTEVDDDRVPVTFKKGKNQLVIKIQNNNLGWGFVCRLLETAEN